MAPRIAFLLLTLLLASCTAPQPSLYQPLAGRDGYAEESLGKGLYRVTFQGNGATSKERVQNYCLYRAAELTLQMGGDRFAVHDKQTDQLTQVTRDYYDSWGYPYYGPYHRRYYRPYPGPSSQSERTTFRAMLTIEPFSGSVAPGGSAFQVYDADKVVEQFAPQIQRPDGPPQ